MDTRHTVEMIRAKYNDPTLIEYDDMIRGHYNLNTDYCVGGAVCRYAAELGWKANTNPFSPLQPNNYPTEHAIADALMHLNPHMHSWMTAHTIASNITGSFDAEAIEDCWDAVESALNMGW